VDDSFAESQARGDGTENSPGKNGAKETEEEMAVKYYCLKCREKRRSSANKVSASKKAATKVKPSQSKKVIEKAKAPA